MILKLKEKLHGDIGLRELVSGGAISFFMQSFGMLLGYLLMALIANYFGARILGVYSLCYAALMLAAIFSTLGLDTVILKTAGKSNDISSLNALKKIYTIVIPWAIVLTCTLIAGISLYSELFFDEVEYKKYLIFAAISIISSVILVINIEYLRAEGKISASEFLRNVVRPLIALFLIIVIYFYDDDLYIPAYVMLASIVLACLLSIYFIFGNCLSIKKNTQGVGCNETAASLIKSGLPMQASALLFYMISNMVIFLIKGYESSAMIGLFLVAMKLAGLINMPLMVLNKVCAPRFSKLYFGNQNNELQKYLGQVSKLAFYAAVMAGVLLVIFSDAALSFFGDDFIHAKSFLFILVVGQIVSCASGSVGIFMMMTGNEKAYQNIAAIVAILSLLSYIVILPRYGIISAAYVLACSQAALNIASAIYIKYRLGFTTMYIPFARHSFSGKQ